MSLWKSRWLRQEPPPPLPQVPRHPGDMASSLGLDDLEEMIRLRRF
jgi:hypothetical protein